MGKMRRLLTLLLALFILFLAGDYLNLPLWPVDWLIPTFPLEIRLVLKDADQQETERILKQSEYLELTLYEAGGTPIRNLKPDNRGIARCVLQQGRYSFSAVVPVIEENDWFFYAYPADGNIAGASRRIQKGDSIIRLELEKKRDISNDAMETIFRMYLLNGDTGSALVLSSGLSTEKQNDIAELRQIQTDLAALPVSAYNSTLNLLDRASVILSRNGIEPGWQVLMVNDQKVFLESRAKAVRAARDGIVRSSVRIMQEFHTSGQMINALEEWNQLTGNSELYVSGMQLDDETAEALEALQSVVKDVQVVIPEEINSSLQASIEAYETGDLSDARSRFMRLLTFIRNLSLENEYHDMEFMIIEYLDDIELIVEANHAIRSDRLDRAMELYDLVARPNKMVEDRRAEAMEFLAMRNRSGVD